MKIQIDQSGKVDRTNQDTIVAFSNGKSHVIKVSAKTKRKLQENFRKIGEPKLFMIDTFCALIFLVTRDHLKGITIIEIDKEYPGKDKYIISTLKRIFQEQFVNLPEISFVNIGKKSKAHEKAIEAYRKQIIPTKTISLRELSKICLKNKNRRPGVSRKRL